jgi:hypothetical protein
MTPPPRRKEGRSGFMNEGNPNKLHIMALPTNLINYPINSPKIHFITITVGESR